MSPAVSEEVVRFVRELFRERSLAERVRRQDHRPAILKQIADSHEIRVVPDLFRLFATGDSVAPLVAQTIAELVLPANPVQLAWLDERLRPDWYAYHAGAWRKLEPADVLRLAESANLDPAVVGLLASHPNGFVRAAVLEVMARHTGGQEIPFLSLRVNDWVDPVAARARELLISRLRPDNRPAVVNALPFIVRVLGQRRRDHSGIERALKLALLSDGGETALARSAQFDTSTRRKMYEVLIADSTTSKQRLLDAALKDPDSVIRGLAIRSAATYSDFSDRAETLERLLRDDCAPSVRRLALSLLSELMPERVAGLFPVVLLDRAASVRGLARYVAGAHRLAVSPHAVYVEGLVAASPRRLAAAIEGVGETGTRADADLIAPFLSGNMPRIRRSALRSLARLDVERAISAAIAAFADDAPSVRAAAAAILTIYASRADFEVISRRVRSLPNAKARAALIRVFLEAPKWEAPFFLLETLSDSDDGVRSQAVRLVDRWIETFNRSQTQPTATQLRRIGALLDSVASRVPEKTARMLRFSIKPSEPSQ